MVTPDKDDLIEKKFGELCKDFGKWVNIANQDGRPDSPARHFHLRTINRLKGIGLDGVFKDALFFDYLYATLPVWGMDRGKKENRLFGFQDFMNGICRQKEKITGLGSQNLATLNSKDSDFVFNFAGQLWKLVEDISIGISTRENTLVLGTKTLHHFLPDLVPPIDGEYTLHFFSISGKGEKQFVSIFIKYLDIYKSEHDLIGKLTSTNPLNSSTTKTIDNAIIGYVKSERKG
jgi:hypothetical protein